jgi:hypothetical protein
LTNEEVSVCPHCGMHIDSIPGYLRERHETECGGGGEGHLAMEDRMISDQRMIIHERKIREQEQRARQELEDAEKKERFDRIRDEAMARQLGKDRKKKLKDEARELLKKR